MFDPNLARFLNPYLLFAATIGILLSVIGVCMGEIPVLIGMFWSCIFIGVMALAALIEEQD
jgi:hypothetical protein